MVFFFVNLLDGRSELPPGPTASIEVVTAAIFDLGLEVFTDFMTFEASTCVDFTGISSFGF